MLNEYGELNVSYLYETFLNGGCPVTDWDDVKSWAEKLLKVEGTKNETETF